MPRATVVACSDSRIQSDAFHKSPVNDLFFIRNIGNQIKSAEGSVEYGVHHLHTPVLLIIGHSHCGAIQAALSDYSKESKAIRQELDNLHLPKATDLNQGVIENINQDTRSLEQPVGDDEDKSTLGEFIADDKISAPDQDSSRRILSDHVREVLSDLTPKERKILEMRYGLMDGIQHTLEEVGQEFGVTRERIRQIEAKVHEKLRSNEKVARLKNHFD